MSIKAIVRLAPGQVGFYDELTGIHLTIRRPQAAIQEGMNVSGIKTSVASGRLILISGSLTDKVCTPIEEPCKKQEVLKKEEVVEVTKTEPQEEVLETVMVETIEAIPAEQSVEKEEAEPAVKVIEKVAPAKKKAATKKKATTKKEEE